MLGRGAIGAFTSHLRSIAGVVSGIATSAPVLTRTSAVTAYPPTVSFTRPIDWQDGDKAVMQWSTDYTFATGVTETATPVTLTAAVTTYNFGLSAIVAGVVYMRLGAWRGARPGSLNWSNTTGVGNATVPTISSASTMADYQFAPGTLALTASMAATWAIVGGSGMAQFTVSGSTLSSLAQSATGTLIVQVQATSLFGVASAVQTITDTVATNTASAFPFTNVVNATLATVYTSNTITVAGIIGAGFTNPISITGAGTYSKNGGAYGVTSSTVVNGDTITLHDTSTAANDITTVTIGATSSTWVVTTSASASVAKLPNGIATGSLDRSPFIDVTSNFIATCNAGVFDAACARANISVPSVAKFEATASVWGASHVMYVGMCDRSVAFGPGNLFPHPGAAGQGAGLSMKITQGGLSPALSINGGIVGPTLTIAPAASDVWAIERNGSIVTFRVKQGGTTTVLGPYTLTSQIPTDWTAFVAIEQTSDQWTTNFGATAWVITSAISGW